MRTSVAHLPTQHPVSAPSAATNEISYAPRVAHIQRRDVHLQPRLHAHAPALFDETFDSLDGEVASMFMGDAS
jgi:hypothetical protein